MSSETQQAAVVGGVTIDDLYKNFGILADAKEEAGKHEDVYLQIIAGTKGGSKEKQLASNFITRFFKHFAKLMPQAIDAIFDLCEEDDVTIRKSAIKDLATLSKDCSTEHLNRIADVLTQLLQTDDQQEFIQVTNSLLTVFKQNPKSSLNEIFNQINTAELEQVRKRAIQFLVSKIPALFEEANRNPSPTSPFNKELEESLVKHIKHVLTDVDAEEFILFIRLLTSLPSMSTLTGRQDLVNIIMSQSELDKPFEENDLERLMILLSCIQQAIPLFSKNVPSAKHVNLFIQNVLGSFVKLSCDENTKFEILKSLADMCVHYNSNPLASAVQQSNQSETKDIMGTLYDVLIEYLPKPPTESTTESNQDEDAKFNFSYVECLLLAFHTVGKFNQSYLTSEENKERLKDFRLRLQYFAKGTQNYIKELRGLLSAAPSAGSNSEETKVRRVALKVTTNIDLLIKDFFHNPPSYKTLVTPSWKASELQQQQQQQNKRSLSVDNGAEGGDQHKKRVPERGIYQPPSGKYSVNANANGNASNGNGNSGQFKRRTFSHDQSNNGNGYHGNGQQRNGGFRRNRF